LEDHDIKVITNAVSVFKTLKSLKLDLSNNKIKTKGAQNISIMFAKFPNLAKLSINFGGYICDKGLEFLSNGISKLSNLTSLRLGLCRNNIGLGLVALSKNIKNLQLSKLKICLKSNYVDNNSLKFFSNVLNQMSTLSVLKLNLYDNEVSDKEMKEFEYTIPSRIFSTSKDGKHFPCHDKSRFNNDFR